MLVKLIKYDMKSLNRFLIVLHAFLLAAAVIGRVTIMNRINFESSDLNVTLMLLVFSVYFIIFIAVSFGTYIMIAIRFYKNLFSDDGYFTHTLPVTRGQLLLSKTITGSIWAILDTILIIFSVYILLSTNYIVNSLKEVQAELLSELGYQNMQQFNEFLLTLFIFMIMGAISSVVMIYLSITVGQMFASHHILGSIIAYFAISTVISIATTVIMAVTGLLTSYNTYTDPSHLIDYNVQEYIWEVFLFSGILSLILLVGFYIVTYVIMKKRVNLA